MNQETIENHIKNLSYNDFNNVLTLVLNGIFNFNAVDVDGPGDGGTDYRCLEDSSGNSIIAIQRTTQQNNWQQKAISDAQKVKDNYSAQLFYFFTSRAHSRKALDELEKNIFAATGIGAKCYGAKEIAGTIINYDRINDFARAINLCLDINISDRPDQRELALHTYACLSNDRNELQNEFYDTSIILCLNTSNKSISRNDLISLTIESSGIDEAKTGAVERRIDELLRTKMIISNNKLLSLSKEAINNIKIANGIYDKELDQMTKIHANIIEKYSGKWDNDKSKRAASLFAKWFVDEQIQNGKIASLTFALSNINTLESDHKNELKQLINSAGCNANINQILVEMVEQTRKMPLVNKLMNAVVYVALENSKSSNSPLVLGRKNWKDIKVIIDSSVGIPYLCTSLFGPSKGRFSKGANLTIKLLKNNRANLRIPWYYLNECASHLVAAQDYLNFSEFKNDLEFSQNGYVSHYYQLLNAGEKVPKSLSHFLKIFSDHACTVNKDKKETIKKVQYDLQLKLRDYGVEFEKVNNKFKNHRQEIETEYMYTFHSLNRSKPQTLVDHDICVLSHIKRCNIEERQTIVCLTWDTLMIRLGTQPNIGGWIMSPFVITDLLQSKMNLKSNEMLALAHKLARITERKSFLGAIVLDRISQFASKEMKDWEFKQHITEFLKEVHERTDMNHGNYDLTSLYSETDKLLQNLGVETTDDVIYSANE